MLNVDTTFSIDDEQGAMGVATRRPTLKARALFGQIMMEAEDLLPLVEPL